jgi:integration host factor subunit alpha
MSSKTVTRADLSEAIVRKIGLPRSEASEIVEAVLDEVADALVSGQNVKLSSFGSFLLRDKRARMGRNPKTGEEVPITPRRVLSFRPSHVLKDRLTRPSNG